MRAQCELVHIGLAASAGGKGPGHWRPGQVKQSGSKRRVQPFRSATSVGRL